MRRLAQFGGLALLAAACAVQPLTPTPEALATVAPVNIPLTTETLVPTAWPTEAPPTATPAIAASPTTAAPTDVPPTSAPNLALALPANGAVDTPVPPVVIAPPPSADVAAAEQYTIDLMNAQRAAAGVAPLARDETLMGIARARVADMIARNYTGHTDPVTGEHLARSMMRAAGYTSNYLGENWYGTVNAPPSIADIAMNWFMTDPPHANNILSPNYVGVGVGIGFNGQEWLLVQNFAGQ
jgi:uncharacterized protein YkwD